MKKFIEWLLNLLKNNNLPVTPPIEPPVTPPIEPPVTPPVTPPSNDFTITKAAFLFPKQPGDGARNDTLVAFSEETNDAQFQRSLDYMKNIKANAYIVVLVNPDQGSYVRTPYKAKWGGEFDEVKLAKWEKRTQQIVANGMTPIFLMFSSLGKNTAAKQPEHERCISTIIQRFDKYVTMWGVGLEVSEFWSDDYVGDIAKIMKKYTNKPVGTHSAKVTSAKSPNLAWFAYEFWDPNQGDKKSAADCVKMINSAKAKLPGKKIIAGEYNINSAGTRAKEQGKACIDAGAYGAWTGF